jgi:tetratricopeptide (TPR) repeat protein
LVIIGLTSRTLACGLLALALAVCAGPAWAGNKALAQKAYAEGTRRFLRGDYAGALTSFQRAYFHDENPQYLYEIAECFSQLGNRAEAVRFYQLYLGERPAAANRTEVQGKIAALVGPTEPEPARSPLPIFHEPDVVAGAAVAPFAPLATPDQVAASKRWWVWPVAIVASGLAVGIVLAATSHDSFQPTLPDFGPGKRIGLLER